jgi:peroxiredoxin
LKRSPRRFSLALAAFTLALAPLAAGCSSPGTTKTPGTADVAVTGGVAPDFAGQDIDGNPIKLSNHLGKQVVLLDFCSTWCEPCVVEFPHLRKLYEANKAKGFLILAISVDGPETVANVPGFARRNQLSFPMMTDEGNRISSVYNPKRTAPLTVLIDRAGKIVLMQEGYTSGDEEGLASQIAKALGESGASASK